MFNNNRIKRLEDEISRIKEEQFAFIKHFTKIIETINSQNRNKYMWELRQEELEMIEGGKKFNKIRKIL